MKKIISVLLLSCVFLSSCTKDETEITTADGMSAQSQTRAGESSTEAVVFEHLPNPYALHVMQAVYTSHNVARVLEPTHLYVRFLPQDSLQMNVLKYDYQLELFDYPLDIELPEDAVYIDPTIPEGEFSWLYTTVEPDFVFPEDITYEILERCYIPEEDEAIVTTRGGSTNVEEAAFLSLGYPLENQGPETRGRERPRGTIRVYDDVLGSYVPVKKVKIRCHRFIKWSTTYTNEYGEYSMDSKFRFRPHYAIVFDNAKGFDIWGNWGPLARANLNMGWHTNKGHSRDLNKNSKAWEWAAVNNAGYDYYMMCEQTGISKPPKDLKIWVFKNWSVSSAPMLRRINHPIGLNGHSAWINFFANVGYGSMATVLNQLLKKVLPDITIGTKGKNYRKIYDHVNHELSHASHFRTVGSEHWAKYISYIMTYGSYGDGTGKNAELCGIGEMWGYSMGHIQEFEKYYPSGFLNTYSSYFETDWFKPHVFWDLYRKNTLTKKQIYDCLAAGVETYNRLVAKMYEKYPSKADSIENAFLTYGIKPNVSKPGEEAYDIVYVNQEVSSDTSLVGEDMLLRNVSIANKSKFTLQTKGSVTIKNSFSVNRDSQLEITRIK